MDWSLFDRKNKKQGCVYIDIVKSAAKEKMDILEMWSDVRKMKQDCNLYLQKCLRPGYN